MRRRAAIDSDFRTLLTVGVIGDADDHSLLSRFAQSREAGGEEAFRVLVERHGPMVFRVCQQVIGDLQDAEDATQAVFLVLARKAGSIWIDGSLAPWLHGVARRIATKARGRAAARKSAEVRTATVAATLRGTDNPPNPDAADWALIHDEVGRLPEKYRSSVVLCYLQGQTYEQAAKQIGCPVGTVRVRLSRARDQLRSRLERRGFGPHQVTALGLFAFDPGALLFSTAGPTTQAVLFGRARVEAILQVARVLGMSRGLTDVTVTTAVLQLYQGMVRTMMIKQWLIAGACVLGIGMTGAGAFVYAASQDPAPEARRSYAQSFPTLPESAALKAHLDAPDTLAKQIDARLLSAQKRLDAQRLLFEEGKITIDRIIDASSKYMLAKVAASPTREDRLAALKDHEDRMRDLVAHQRSELDVGRGSDAGLLEATAALEAAAFDYLEDRQSAGTTEVETLKRRVEALEKELATLKQKPAELVTPGR